MKPKLIWNTVVQTHFLIHAYRFNKKAISKCNQNKFMSIDIISGSYGHSSLSYLEVKFIYYYEYQKLIEKYLVCLFFNIL